MTVDTKNWKDELGDRIPKDLGEEIDTFERQIQLRKEGKIDEKVFAETRLRRGAYGQRYDNGQRHDGEKSQSLDYPQSDLFKGPDTFWDAPGMMRIKIPFGGLNAEQLEVLADLAEEYSDSISHITTRQDIQLHYVQIDDTPDIMRRLAAVGITTREACGNSVRNITACPRSGVCRDESFDVTGTAAATANFLLGHQDCQDFGRKFKPAFSGCGQHACGLTFMHDVGAIAKVKTVDGKEKRGYEFYVGGGLGSVPHQAKLFDEFLAEEELLPTIQSIARVFGRMGEKTNRAKARIKFLIAKMGIEDFKSAVAEERKKLNEDPRWTDWIQPGPSVPESHFESPVTNGTIVPKEGYENWSKTNIYKQRQDGFSLVTVTTPLGDLSSRQIRGLADLARQYVKETVRITVEQNIIFRWIHDADLPSFYNKLVALNLGDSGAESIVDITACPGTDTCKLGIAASRGLAAELMIRLANRGMQYDDAVKDLRIKISGCFNSCGQHHVAEIGFYGVVRNINNFAVPHFQVILGGQWSENANAYGQGIGAVPSKNIPEVVDRLLDRYTKEKQGNEKFRDFVGRIGKAQIKESLRDLMKIPTYDVDPSYYSDWGDAREFTIGDIGKGECAGEVISVTDFGLADAERELFDCQLLLEGDPSDETGKKASADALHAMMTAAKTLIRMQNLEIQDDDETIINDFKVRFYDTKLFFDPFGGGKFAQHYFDQYADRDQTPNADQARMLVEEAQLFIEAAHKCQSRVLEEGAAGRMDLTVNAT